MMYRLWCPYINRSHDKGMYYLVETALLIHISLLHFGKKCTETMAEANYVYGACLHIYYL